jgi:hypothetical protein
MDCLGGKNLVRIFVRVEASKGTTWTNNRLSDKRPIVILVLLRKPLDLLNKMAKNLVRRRRFRTTFRTRKAPQPGQKIGHLPSYRKVANLYGRCLWSLIAEPQEICRRRSVEVARVVLASRCLHE